MSYLPSLFALAGIHLLAVASPGPAFVAAVQLSVQQSRKIALMHALGLGLAAVVWATGALVGMQALMLQILWLYRVLQFAGGAYLVYVGIQSWLHAGDKVAEDSEAVADLNSWEAFRRGFATNIANPKVMIFFASIFAALLYPAWPLWVRLVVLGIVTVDETGWYAGLAVLLSTKRAQSAYRRAKAGIDRTAGSFMILFGGRLIWNSARGYA